MISGARNPDNYKETAIPLFQIFQYGPTDAMLIWQLVYCDHISPHSSIVNWSECLVIFLLTPPQHQILILPQLF